MPGKALPYEATRPGYIRGEDRFDVVTRLRSQAKSCRRLALTERHLSGYYEAHAEALEMAITEIVRLRGLGLK